VAYVADARVPLVVMSPLAFLTRPERWLQAMSKHKERLRGAEFCL